MNLMEKVLQGKMDWTKEPPPRIWIQPKEKTREKDQEERDKNALEWRKEPPLVTTTKKRK